MKPAFDKWVVVALLFGFAVWLAVGAASVAGQDMFHGGRLLVAALSAGALGSFLLLGKRWARWMAIGWAIDVLANMAAMAVFGGDVRSDPRAPWWSVASIALSAVLTLILLGRPAARRRFEPEWTTPLHHAYRWTAISLTTCATHVVIAGMFGVQQQVWSPAVAAGLTLAAIALLNGARVFGLPVAAAALLAFGASDNVTIPHLALPLGLSAPNGSERWCFFIGGASAVAWVPALAITVVASALAAPRVIRRYF